MTINNNFADNLMNNKYTGHRLFLTATLLVLVAGVASPAYAVPFIGTPSPALSPTFGTLIDFDDQATGTPIGAADYQAQGIKSITETEGLGTFARYAGSQSAPNYIGTGPTGDRQGSTDPDGWDGTILFECIGLASTMGIGIANSVGDPEVVSIYDANFNLLESQVPPAGANVYVGFDRGGLAQIKFLEITGDFFSLDDLQHNCSADVGGEFLSMDTTALFVAGMQSSVMWMIPMLAGAAGVGTLYIRTRMNKD